MKHLVCKLKGSLYRLKQAPGSINLHLSPPLLYCPLHLSLFLSPITSTPNPPLHIGDTKMNLLDSFHTLLSSNSIFYDYIWVYLDQILLWVTHISGLIICISNCCSFTVKSLKISLQQHMCLYYLLVHVFVTLIL